MADSIKISVIIPTYNRAEYICDSIDSVFEQNYNKSSFEVIVIDDGSTDNTKAVIKKYGNKVRYFSIPHSGKPAVARNFGIKKAKGDLIAFQDSDDVWPKDKFKNQIHIFDDENIVMSYGQALAINSNGLVSDNKIVDEDVINYGENFDKLLKTNAISTLTVIVRKDVLKEIGCFNESNDLRAIEDYELWLRISAKYHNGIKMINKPLAYYRKHDNNISIADKLTSQKRIINVLKSLLTYNYIDKKYLKLIDSQLDIYNNDLQRIHDTQYPKPLISVIMSVFNGENYLRSSIDSILNQTFHNFEFIIINDGSTDDSLAIIKSYKDPRIKIINQTNQGLVYSLNKGVEVATGKYIARQDADDISLPSRLEKELALMLSNPRVGLVGTFFTYVNEDTLEPIQTITQPTKDIDIKRSLLLHNPFGHGSTLYKKEYFNNHALYTDKFGPTEDFELWTRISDEYEFRIVPENLYLYRLNPNGISNTKGATQHDYTKKIIERQWKKPFTLKGHRDIVTDGRYYKAIDSPYGYQIYRQYIEQNINLALGCFERLWIKRGMVISYGVLRLDKKSYIYLYGPFLKSILKRLGL